MRGNAWTCRCGGRLSIWRVRADLVCVKRMGRLALGIIE